MKHEPVKDHTERKRIFTLIERCEKEQTVNIKEYTMPNGKKAVFNYDANGVGKITLECMDELMAMIADRPQGEWETEYHGNGWNDYWDYTCSNCGKKYDRADAVLYKANFCPNCGARMVSK